LGPVKNLKKQNLIEKILPFYFLVNLSAHLYEFASRVVFDKVKSTFLSILRIIIFKINKNTSKNK